MARVEEKKKKEKPLNEDGIPKNNNKLFGIVGGLLTAVVGITIAVVAIINITGGHKEVFTEGRRTTYKELSKDNYTMSKLEDVVYVYVYHPDFDQKDYKDEIANVKKLITLSNDIREKDKNYKEFGIYILNLDLGSNNGILSDKFFGLDEDFSNPTLLCFRNDNSDDSGKRKLSATWTRTTSTSINQQVTTLYGRYQEDR